MQRADFSVLVARFSYSLKPFALSLTHDMSDAKDLLQETVYRAIAQQDHFPEGADLKSWLYSIMKTIYSMKYSRKKTAQSSPDAQPVSKKLNYNHPKLIGEIASLTETYRTPFLMHYQGFKYHEISDHLALPLNTIKSRIHAAQKELLKKMGS